MNLRGDAAQGDAEVIGLLSDSLKVDQAPLTGESLPVSMRVGNLTKMGSTVTSGKAMAVVFDHGRNTFMGKTASMIASVDEVGHFQVCCTLRLACLSVQRVHLTICTHGDL